MEFPKDREEMKDLNQRKKKNNYNVWEFSKSTPLIKQV